MFLKFRTKKKRTYFVIYFYASSTKSPKGPICKSIPFHLFVDKAVVHLLNLGELFFPRIYVFIKRLKMQKKKILLKLNAWKAAKIPLPPEIQKPLELFLKTVWKDYQSFADRNINTKVWDDSGFYFIFFFTIYPCLSCLYNIKHQRF